MTHYLIRTLDAAFEAGDGGAEYDRAEDALAAGIRRALAMAVDAIDAGAERDASGVEICVEGEDGRVIRRSIVAVSHSTLLVEKAPAALV